VGSPAPSCWARRRLLSEVEASGQQRSSRAGRHRRTAVARGQANRTVRRTVRRAGAPPSCWARHRAVARGRPDRTARSCWARGRPLAREAACWVRRRVVGCGAGCCCCPIPRRSDRRSGATSGCCPQSSRVGRRHPGGVGCCPRSTRSDSASSCSPTLAPPSCWARHRAVARGQPDRTMRSCWARRRAPPRRRPPGSTSTDDEPRMTAELRAISQDHSPLGRPVSQDHSPLAGSSFSPSFPPGRLSFSGPFPPA
jgi:hypothetical protein